MEINRVIRGRNSSNSTNFWRIDIITIENKLNKKMSKMEIAQENKKNIVKVVNEELNLSDIVKQGTLRYCHHFKHI